MLFVSEAIFAWPKVTKIFCDVLFYKVFGIFCFYFRPMTHFCSLLHML